MSSYDARHDDPDFGALHPGAGLAPGKRTLTQGLPPPARADRVVQARQAPDAAAATPPAPVAPTTAPSTAPFASDDPFGMHLIGTPQ